MTALYEKCFISLLVSIGLFVLVSFRRSVTVLSRGLGFEKRLCSISRLRLCLCPESSWLLGVISRGMRLQEGRLQLRSCRRHTRWVIDLSRLCLWIIRAMFTLVLLIMMVSRQVIMLLSSSMRKLLYLCERSLCLLLKVRLWNLTMLVGLSGVGMCRCAVGGSVVVPCLILL